MAPDASEAARLALKHLQSQISDSEKVNGAFVFDIAISLQVGPEVDEISNVYDQNGWYDGKNATQPREAAKR